MEKQKMPISVGGNLIGSAVVSGNDNIVKVNYEKIEIPPFESVDISSEINSLKEIFADLKLSIKDCQRIKNALNEAELESNEKQPDHDEIGSALERALKYAQKAEGFANSITKLKPHIQNVAGWLGENWYKLLATVGLSV